MPGVIFLIEGEKLIELREEQYDSEDLLQRLLEDYPKILAGDQINTEFPRRWLLISREIGVPDDQNRSNRWSLDHLFIDQEGIPTFVEVKRSTDTRARREVVAQMLDYAANGVEYWNIPEIKVQFELRCSRNGKNPSDVVKDALGPEVEYDTMWTLMENNLKNRKIRLLFVADEIPKELKRIVEFLNEEMEDVEVLAVEVKQYTGEHLKTLVPRIIGQTSEAEQKKAGPNRQWDEQSFIDELGKRGLLKDVAVVKRILEWVSEKNLKIWWGRGSQSGSFYPLIDLVGGYNQIFGVWTYGKIEIEFQWMSKAVENKILLSFLHKLNEIPGVSLSENSLKGRPSFPISVLHSDEQYSKFINAILSFVQEVREKCQEPD
ncbi:MAG: hypothetical protein ACP5NU_03545 [Methanomicrobiales archaeon]